MQAKPVSAPVAVQGGVSAHASTANGQRDRNTHPVIVTSSPGGWPAIAGSSARRRDGSGRERSSACV